MIGEKQAEIGKRDPMPILFMSSAILSFFIALKIVSASDILKIIGVPPFIHFLLLLNLFQSTVGIIMVLQVKKVSISPIWNDLCIGSLLGMLHPLVLAIILNENYAVLSSNIFVLNVLLYTFAVFMVNTTK